MALECGIVGLPNVGKSTLFNAMARSAEAEVANYPFCTIDPNTAEVPLADPRLERIAEAAESARRVPARQTFVDIAGLVAGASRGEGLGNRFLGQIREADAIIHVLRCFDDADIAHVAGAVDPVADAETVRTELLLADLESATRQMEAKRKQGGDPLLERALELLEAGRPAREAGDPAALRRLGMLTAIPVLYVANLGEGETGNALSARAEAMAADESAPCVALSASLEAELARLDDGDRQAFLEDLGMERGGVDRLVEAAHRLLGLATFFTAGPTETRAWTIPEGMPAAEAAGRVHTDFTRGFIAAEVVGWEDYVKSGGEAGTRRAGLMRLEGRDYPVRDGDVMRVRFNV